ncbi:hypothetical protein QWI17_08575 [Gilvimarinus sp. SDUM040013]|uniref:Cytochrome c domain-containing protein n=1 Tax=Gilvimarinus gilvus TaxID=3058038 RepID=A0ABU4S2B7_9GAMM|nr:hypothetical protein [Gilvimarinus sp. SDUM040013]MDO3385890.1 hypothetical protein [Gilvimarinus sp. SDUM040013]MDX6850607.1 hypothetical protein [Gilvimarinus sp. SDUM040013]
MSDNARNRVSLFTISIFFVLVGSPVGALTSDDFEQRLFHSGGVAGNFRLCPKSAFDTIVPLSDSSAGESITDMTIAGVNRYIQENNVRSIDELLTRLPVHYRTNFSLVEHTRATGQSSLERPRIILFGSDGMLLMNIGTKPDDPTYHKLDIAQLHKETGAWEFSVFDFTQQEPVLTRNAESCRECHGGKNSRPVWGTNLDWPGVFGDNIAEGPQGEALDDRHARAMNSIMAGEGASGRFSFLLWRDELLQRGGKRQIAHHDFGAELLLSNIAMGSATARGAFTRLKNHHKYDTAKSALILAYYLRKGNAFLSHNEQKKADKFARELGANEFTLDALLEGLGVDPHEAFSLATLHSLEPPHTNWSLGRADLYDLLMLQVFNDLRNENENVDRLLSNRRSELGVLDCPTTAHTIADVIDFKMVHLFYLTGYQRYQVNRVFYPLDLEDIYDRVFLPVSAAMIALSKRAL